MNIEREILLNNLNKIHTTELGYTRIFKATMLQEYESMPYIKEVIKDSKSTIYKKGKNYYIEFENIKIVINASTYCVITIAKK